MPEHATQTEDAQEADRGAAPSLDDRAALRDDASASLADVARARLRSGDFGALPVIIGLILIVVIFTLLNDRFLSALNITNLVLQIGATGTIAVGVVLILLLGEIDLSVAAVSGFAAGVMAVLNVSQGVPGPLAILSALLVGAAIGAFNGLWVTKLHVPSFVVTLAGLLGWQGALLYVLGSRGTVNISDESITFLARSFLPTWLGWAVAVVVVVGTAVSWLLVRRERAQQGLGGGPSWLIGSRIVLTAVGVFGAVAFLGRDRGVPMALVILLGLVVILHYVTRRTRFGRHIYAVGGNVEAARRAGVDVDGLRVMVFTLASTLAALGGVIAAARLLSVNQASGGGDLLLNAIAAGVIGGTSLFGGRGSVWAAFLGALVIGSISNGMDLLALDSSIKFMVTGAVLLLAVTVDAAGRRNQAAG